MRITDIYDEIIDKKYKKEADYRIYGKYSLYQDNMVPFYISLNSMNYSFTNILSPNSLNFIDNDNELSAEGFKALDELAQNKYDIDFGKITNNHCSNNNHTTIVVIGYGGFMSNMFYFLRQKYLQSSFIGYLFYDTKIYENDDFSLINNLRTFQDTSKLEYSTDYDEKSKLNLARYITQGSANFSTINLFNKKFDKNTLEQLKEYDDNRLSRTIYIGSPDMETRKLLENENFLFFGNSNDDFIIEKSPIVDSMVQETYGKLNIVKFWVGILESMYGFCRILEKYTAEELSNIPKDTNMFSLNVSKEFENPNKFLTL